jgi:hypothetical protein
VSRQNGIIVACLIAVASACFSEKHELYPVREFGRVDVLVDGRTLRGTVQRNSVVAVYWANLDKWDIHGVAGGPPEDYSVELAINCTGTLSPGTYKISTPDVSPVSLRMNRDRVSWLRRRIVGFESLASNVKIGTLEIDSIDRKSGTIAGRFAAWVGPTEGSTGKISSVVGDFNGRIRTVDIPRRGPMLMQPSPVRDCSALRAGPVST